MEQKLDQILKAIEDLNDKVTEVLDGQERIQESIANLSLPGPNYSYETVDDEDSY